MQTTTDLFERLIPLLERAGIPYMVAGSVAEEQANRPKDRAQLPFLRQRLTEIQRRDSQ